MALDFRYRRLGYVVVHEGPEPGLQRVRWQMKSAADMAKIRVHLSRLGIQASDVPEDECETLGVAGAFRATEPHSGATFEYFSDFNEADAREPRKLAPGLTSIDYWDGAPTPDMARVGAIEPLGQA